MGKMQSPFMLNKVTHGIVYTVLRRVNALIEYCCILTEGFSFWYLRECTHFGGLSVFVVHVKATKPSKASLLLLVCIKQYQNSSETCWYIEVRGDYTH